jgi:hypothetical protein
MSQQEQAALEISEEEAYSILLTRLKAIVKPVEIPVVQHFVPAQAFDVEINEIVYEHLKRFNIEKPEHIGKLMPIFYSAAWELCLRGVLRPSYKSSPNHAGKVPTNGYSITERGKLWLQNINSPIFVAMGEFAQQLSKYEQRFGSGYFERAQEAVKSYFAGAYFACCAMCGAAAESILLRLAVEKLGDEKKALQIYHGKQGRKDLKDKVLELGQKPDGIKNEVLAGLTILAYWRDDAAHGSALNIDSTQANIAMQMLCLFALAAEKHWTILTT